MIRCTPGNKSTLSHWSAAIFLLFGMTAWTGIKQPSQAVTQITPPVPLPVVARPPAKIALALGGGAARGFAHVGVIKALEAQGISPTIVVGTSAGPVVGGLYAAGLSGFQIQELSTPMEDNEVLDGSALYRCIART